MKNQYIQHSRRAPFIGPRPSQVPRKVGTALAVTAAAFVIAYAATWLAMELKNLS